MATVTRLTQVLYQAILNTHRVQIIITDASPKEGVQPLCGSSVLCFQAFLVSHYLSSFFSLLSLFSFCFLVILLVTVLPFLFFDIYFYFPTLSLFSLFTCTVGWGEVGMLVLAKLIPQHRPALLPSPAPDINQRYFRGKRGGAGADCRGQRERVRWCMEIHGRPWSGWPIIIHHHPETSYSHQWKKGTRQIYVSFYQYKQGGWFVSGKQEAKFLQVHLDTKENKCFLVSDHAVLQLVVSYISQKAFWHWPNHLTYVGVSDKTMFDFIYDSYQIFNSKCREQLDFLVSAQNQCLNDKIKNSRTQFSLLVCATGIHCWLKTIKNMLGGWHVSSSQTMWPPYFFFKEELQNLNITFQYLKWISIRVSCTCMCSH